MEVIWTDANLEFDDETKLDDEAGVKGFGKLANCHDIGFLVRKNAKEIVLALSVSPDDDTIRHSTAIPRPWVQRIVFLQEK